MGESFNLYMSVPLCVLQEYADELFDNLLLSEGLNTVFWSSDDGLVALDLQRADVENQLDAELILLPLVCSGLPQAPCLICGEYHAINPFCLLSDRVPKERGKQSVFTTCPSCLPRMN